MSSSPGRCCPRAWRATTAQQAARLADAGVAPYAETRSLDPVDPDEHAIFGVFSKDAKQALARANHAAASLRAEAIGPVHLVLGVLAVAPQDALAERLGLRASRVRAALATLHEDPTPPPEVRPPADAALERLLASLPAGADTLACLAAFHSAADVTEELRQVLLRNKVSPALLARASGAFGDP